MKIAPFPPRTCHGARVEKTLCQRPRSPLGLGVANQAFLRHSGCQFELSLSLFFPPQKIFKNTQHSILKIFKTKTYRGHLFWGEEPPSPPCRPQILNLGLRGPYNIGALQGGGCKMPTEQNIVSEKGLKNYLEPINWFQGLARWVGGAAHVGLGGDRHPEALAGMPGVPGLRHKNHLLAAIVKLLLWSKKKKKFDRTDSLWFGGPSCRQTPWWSWVRPCQRGEVYRGGRASPPPSAISRGGGRSDL